MKYIPLDMHGDDRTMNSYQTVKNTSLYIGELNFSSSLFFSQLGRVKQVNEPTQKAGRSTLFAAAAVLVKLSPVDVTWSSHRNRSVL